MSGINDMVVSDYHDKGTDFSASDFTRPTYQLWVSKNCKKNEDDKQSLPAWVGQLVHDASYRTPEIGVIKEFSPTATIDIGDGELVSIGGSIDRIEHVLDNLWQIADIKTQGMYPAKKAFKAGGEEKWTIQLSVYRWLLDKYGFKTTDVGTIHQYVMGFQKNKDGMEEYNKLEISLMSIEQTEEMMLNKIDIATGEEPRYNDCPTQWMCESYCSYNKSCPHYNKGGS